MRDTVTVAIHGPRASRRTRCALAAVLSVSLACGLQGIVRSAAAQTTMAQVHATAKAGTSVDDSTPQSLIETLSASILHTIKADPQIKEGDTHRIEQVVNTQLLPYTDFRKTTRLALGPAWWDATEAQRDDLVQQFELLLIHLYAGAAAKVGDQTVNVKPVRVAADATDVVVQTDVISGGQPYPVAYRLEKGANGWRIYDVNVANLWLIAAYRPQFTSKVQASGVQGLIAFLQRRNKELAQQGAGTP
ncbi:MlaC/ttg2D family ABC transporter substrate-binding protein [Robbsia andropogonis]|uniref:MlaC/ttg2D family ABC transporter substrate-binding protein n=1 Tax=Robbsia andropogonis TaxID=28092 RepID=UPI003D22947A